jgi:hypothetical protein
LLAGKFAGREAHLSDVLPATEVTMQLADTVAVGGEAKREHGHTKAFSRVRPKAAECEELIPGEAAAATLLEDDDEHEHEEEIAQPEEPPPSMPKREQNFRYDVHNGVR